VIDFIVEQEGFSTLLLGSNSIDESELLDDISKKGGKEL
jgi:hypothetical protein